MKKQVFSFCEPASRYTSWIQVRCATPWGVVGGGSVPALGEGVSPPLQLGGGQFCHPLQRVLVLLGLARAPAMRTPQRRARAVSSGESLTVDGLGRSGARSLFPDLMCMQLD